MDYNTDRPIEKSDQDLLGRSSFARLLGKAIFEYNGNLYGQVYHSYMKKHKFKRCNYLFRAE